MLRAELDVIRPHWNGVRLHTGFGFVMPNDEHEGQGPAIRNLGKPVSDRHVYTEHQQQPDRGPHYVV